MEPPKGLLHPLSQRRNGVPVGNVAGHRFALTACGANLPRCVLQAGKRASADNGGCAQASQFERDCCAYATSSPGNQGNFAVQSVVHLLSVLNFRRLIFKKVFHFGLPERFP
jgi:hypothetical protein